MKFVAATTTVNILTPNEVQKQEFRLIESAILEQRSRSSSTGTLEKHEKTVCRLARYTHRLCVYMYIYAMHICAYATAAKGVASRATSYTITIKGGREHKGKLSSQGLSFLRRIITGNNSRANICTPGRKRFRNVRRSFSPDELPKIYPIFPYGENISSDVRWDKIENE